MARRFQTLGRRTIWIGSLGIAIGVTSALVAYALTALIGQFIHVTDDERKTLLAAGAAAGMAAIFAAAERGTQGWSPSVDAVSRQV